MKDTELVGPRVILRPLKKHDFDQWSEIRQRCRDWLEPWEPGPQGESLEPVKDREGFYKRCNAWERQKQFDSAYGFGLFLHDETLLGEVSVGNIQRGPMQSANIGYWIDEGYAGQGLVPEAVVLLLQYAFESLSLHRVEIAIVPRNVASLRVVEKLGLRNEGLSERFLQIRGVWEDHLRYAITLEEWQEFGSELTGAYLS